MGGVVARLRGGGGGRARTSSSLSTTTTHPRPCPGVEAVGAGRAVAVLQFDDVDGTCSQVGFVCLGGQGLLQLGNPAPQLDDVRVLPGGERERKLVSLVIGV